MNLKKILKKTFIKLDIHKEFVWISNIKEKYCNKTDFISRYCALIRHSALEHMISFHFHITNWFFRMIQETIEHYILNLILKLDNEYFIWIWLLNLIIKNALEFDYMFNSYHMQYIRIEIISSINFLSCAIFCILWKHYNLTLNKIIFFETFMKSVCFLILCCIFFHYFFCLITTSCTW